MKYVIVILSVILSVQSALAAPFNANAKTKRVPAGTKFSLQLMSPLTTYMRAGNEFSAVLLADKVAGSDVVLPMGSLVRGEVTRIVPARRLSRGAVLYINFDHVVTPNGRQLPLSFSVTGRTDLTYDGGITGGRGYKASLVENWHRTVGITKGAVDWGNYTFEDFAGGYFRIITVPTAAIGGGIGGGAYYTYEFFADMLKKGAEVNLPKGEVIEVILTQPIDVPVI
ncbi:MAG: hypothetical protein LBK53_06890 [Heliobacteriaceae bacterium]|jgi:hypothetical protein|nr:hypothetical protein [Heliobacteriaceae bacterium]